jgi:hypothetical protein
MRQKLEPAEEAEETEKAIVQIAVRFRVGIGGAADSERGCGTFRVRAARPGTQKHCNGRGSGKHRGRESAQLFEDERGLKMPLDGDSRPPCGSSGFAQRDPERIKTAMAAEVANARSGRRRKWSHVGGCDLGARSGGPGGEDGHEGTEENSGATVDGVIKARQDV